MDFSSPIGLIAGNGQFPCEFIKNAKSRGLDVVMAAHHGETDPELAKEVSQIIWLRVGQLGKIIKFFKKYGVKQAAFVGGIKKKKLFIDLRPDFTGMLTLAKLRTLNDDMVLRAICERIEKSGISIFSASEFLQQCVVKKGLLSSKALNKEQVSDALVAWDAAGVLGELDIGQSVIAKRRSVVAVEAVEGTDACIKRAGELVGDGCVLVKRSKPGQDLRFDMPVIGVQTIEALKEIKAAALVLQAESTMILEPTKVVSMANEAGIVIVAAGGREEIG
jgi:UDP-2,3-diacylglucosamine hydrolase